MNILPSGKSGFRHIARVHCVGIGGIGLSALAQYFLATGKTVSGTDGVATDLTRYLERCGVVFSTIQDGELISPQVIESSGHRVGNKKSKIPKSQNPKIPTPDSRLQTPDLVVYSPAIPMSNGDLKKAKELGIPMMTYPEALGKLTSEKVTIAVCGTHGKSTTTAMISLMMVEALMDPTVIIGTKVRWGQVNSKQYPVGSTMPIQNHFIDFSLSQEAEIAAPCPEARLTMTKDVGTNFRYGKSEFLVIEACEYKDSFLQYFPHIIVCPNVDVDHLDYFKTEENYRESFRRFFKSLPHGGYLVGEQGAEFRGQNSGDGEEVTGKQKGIEDLTKKIKGTFAGVVFGEEHFIWNEKEYPYPKVGIPGKHNRTNAALAFVTGKILNIPEEVILRSLAKFTGTWRRFEHRGMLNGATVIDDYGHHPTEIAATLAAAREIAVSDKRLAISGAKKQLTSFRNIPNRQLPIANRLIIVYQPHQYSRTKIFLEDFGRAFAQADLVIVPNIYQARNDDPIISVQELVDVIAKNGTQAMDGGGLQETAKWLNENAKKGDTVITMGAGNIDGIYEWLNIDEIINSALLLQ